MKRGFSPIYILILSSVLIIILSVNGILEIKRTRSGFFLLLEREGLALLQNLERNVKEVLSFLKEDRPYQTQHTYPLTGESLGIEELIIEYLLGIAHRVDKNDSERQFNLSDFKNIVENSLLTSIEIFDPSGNLLRGFPPEFRSDGKKEFLNQLINKKQSVFSNLFIQPPGQKESTFYTIAIIRKFIPGIIAIHIENNQMKRLYQIFSIQKAISDINLREGIIYVSVQDASLNIIGHTDFLLIGKKEEDNFLKNSLKTMKPLSRFYKGEKNDEVFEILKPFSFEGKTAGIIRIGFSTKEIKITLERIKKNVILSIIFFLLLGVSALFIIWINQNRHLKKLKEMETRIQLAERISSLGHLASAVAHEIRNPLNAISMGIQRIRREYSPSEEQKKKDFLSFIDIILKEIKRVNDIVNQFLTLSKPFKLNIKTSSIEEILENLITLFFEEANSKNITFEKEFKELPMVKIDPELLTQALINLMKNSIEAMKDGGIIRIEARTLKDYLEIILSDSGMGIPEDQIEKVFDYYYTTKENGTGLGLPIAHRIIEAHNGELKLESKPGLGTRVSILIPIQK